MFYLRNFKNFAEAELDDDRPVTLLAGPNASGKSNLIEAVELLSFLASGRPLHEITDLGRGGALEVRGSPDACAARGQTAFTLGYQCDLPTGDGPKNVSFEICIRVGKEPRITEESLRIGNREIREFEILPSDAGTTSAGNVVRYDNNARGKNKPTASVAADRSAPSQYARFAHGNKKLPLTLELIDALTARLTAPSVFDPIPKLMRGYERESETRLARNGFNISPVLADLSRKRYLPPAPRPERERRVIVRKSFSLDSVAERILKRISQLPGEPFLGFEFVRSKTGDVIFAFKTPDHSQPLSARLISDGTLRALAILTALETSPHGQRLVLEEFDLPGYIEFLEQGRLGDLVTRRDYERHLNPNYESERESAVNKWLEALP